MSFYELHTRSAFSFLSSGSQPQRLVQRAAELGMAGAALLDRDTVAGAVRFHFEAREHGLKPIIGAEITMDDGSLLPLVLSCGVRVRLRPTQSGLTSAQSALTPLTSAVKDSSSSLKTRR